MKKRARIKRARIMRFVASIAAVANVIGDAYRASPNADHA
jgi:hypothetical protein